MADVFLDLGTHYGEGLGQFVGMFNINKTWTVHTFEANPTTFDIFVEHHLIKTPFAVAHNAAISNKDGYVQLNIETPPNEGDTGQGSSIISLDEWNPWDGSLRQNFQKEVTVPCIDLSRHILDHFSKDDNIIVKMDIEGSEFDVFEVLIESGAIEYINKIYVEWHEHYFFNKEEMSQRKQAILAKLSNYNIEHYNWH